MPSRTIEESIAIREWITKALAAGKDSPRTIKEYIEQYSELDRPPSVATIGNILKEQGYVPLGVRWQKKGSKS